MAQSDRRTWQETLQKPEFGAEIAHRAMACTPRELFSRLSEHMEDSVHYFEAAFAFALDALERAPAPAIPPAPATLCDALLGWAAETLPPSPACPLDSPWPALVVRQFAPLGLSDGCWLSGSMLANAVESEPGMRLLRQLMIRLGDPGTQEGYAPRYAGLMRSLGISPAVIAGDETTAVADVSYEHALLGVCLGLFPTTLAGEILGFNLWMAGMGPCPLLEGLQDVLAQRGTCVRYFARYDRPTLLPLARAAVADALAEGDSQALQAAIVRGFVAAHDSYQRWAAAMEVLRAGEDSAGHPSLAPVGLYAAPQDAEALRAFALGRYGRLGLNDLYFCLANSDLHPPVRLFARVFVGGVLAQLGRALDEDERLNSREPPTYSEREVARIVAEQHLKNVRSRENWTPEQTSTDGAGDPADDIHAIFDGCWLQGFADVRRANREEYGWLFRIYASEHGDGDLSWNHCQIFRRAYAELGPDVMLPKADRALYELFRINVSAAAKLAVSLNTRHFLPEILGMNLGIEATGVGGDYMERWKRARRERSKWKELAYRLHNSIDNYADGHTKWSLAAVQAYMKRVGEAAPSEVPSHWHRIWRLWRFQDLASHGSVGEREALRQHFEVRSLAPM
jgi:hypothetical protein